MTNIISYNQLMQMFKDFADAHLQINDFGNGPTSEIGTSKQMSFPYLWITHRNSSNISVTNKTSIPEMNLTFIIADQINIQKNIKNTNGSNSDNTQEILSDTFQIAQDLVNYISVDMGKFGVMLTENQITLDPIYDDTEDKVAGWVMDLSIKLKHSNCITPLGDIVFTPTNNFKTLLLSDGITEFDTFQTKTYTLPNHIVKNSNESFLVEAELNEDTILNDENFDVIVNGTTIDNITRIPMTNDNINITNDNIYIDVLNDESTPTQWVRPAEWLSIPSVTTGEEVIYILCAIYDNDSNYIAFLCNGNYTVDWGDGTIENIASGVKAQRNINYTTVSNLTSYGYKQALIKITPQVGSNLTKFDLQQTHSALLPTGKGSNMIVDLFLNVPNISGSGNLIISNSTQTIGLYDLQQVIINEIGAITNLYEMFYICSALQSVILNNTSNVTNTSYMFYKCSALESITLSLPGVTDTSNMFDNCNSLKTASLTNLTNLTNASYMFAFCTSLNSVTLTNTNVLTNVFAMFVLCTSLKKISQFNLSNVTNTTFMFGYCYLLKTVTLSLPNVTNTSNMFYNCSALQSVTLSLPNVTNASNMFYNCSALQSITLSLPSVTDTSNMFNNCSALQSAILTNLTNVTNTSYMFYSCFSLQSITLSLPGVTDTSNMFNYCSSLQSAILTNLTNLTNATNMFNNCNVLTNITLTNLSSLTNASNMFARCPTLQSVTLSLPNVTNISSMFVTCYALHNVSLTVTSQIITNNDNIFDLCYSLEKLTLTNFKNTINLSNLKLTKKAIDELGNSVGSGGTTRTLTIQNNPGSATMDTTIWTAKGWTVVR